MRASPPGRRTPSESQRKRGRHVWRVVQHAVARDSHDVEACSLEQQELLCVTIERHLRWRSDRSDVAVGPSSTLTRGEVDSRGARAPARAYSTRSIPCPQPTSRMSSPARRRRRRTPAAIQRLGSALGDQQLLDCLACSSGVTVIPWSAGVGGPLPYSLAASRLPRWPLVRLKRAEAKSARTVWASAFHGGTACSATMIALPLGRCVTDLIPRVRAQPALLCAASAESLPSTTTSPATSGCWLRCATR